MSWAEHINPGQLGLLVLCAILVYVLWRCDQ